jgi:hypothetical protein
MKKLNATNRWIDCLIKKRLLAGHFPLNSALFDLGNWADD